VVAVDRRSQQHSTDAVLVDNIVGSRRATAWLIAQGNTRIATIAGLERTTTGLERLMGYRQALSAAGIPVRSDLVARSDFHVDGGYRAACQLLDQDPRPEAIFVANNQMTVGALAAIADRGLEVPGDVAVACFDQLPAGTRWRDAIATVEQPAYDMGRVAVELLLRRVAGSDVPASEVRLQPELHEPLRLSDPAVLTVRTVRGPAT
jgi:LacI family transcriptional regulator